MAQFIAEPTPADLLDIFGPNSFVPIPLPVINGLLERLLLALPGYAGAGAEQQQSLRRLTMYELAAWMPGDVAEASIAATLVALNAQAMDCFRRAALPEIGAETALREARQANSLLRTMATGRRELERRQTARRKAEDNPTERGGYFAIKYESVAPGFVAPTPGAKKTGGAGQGPVPPQPAQTPVQQPPPPQPAQTPGQAAPGGNGNAPVPPKPQPAPAAQPVTPPTAQPVTPPTTSPTKPALNVTVGDIMQRFEARGIGPGETPEQVWAQCTQETLDAAAGRAAPLKAGPGIASGGSPVPLHATQRRGEPGAEGAQTHRAA